LFIFVSKSFQISIHISKMLALFVSALLCQAQAQNQMGSYYNPNPGYNTNFATTGYSNSNPNPNYFGSNRAVNLGGWNGWNSNNGGWNGNNGISGGNVPSFSQSNNINNNNYYSNGYNANYYDQGYYTNQGFGSSSYQTRATDPLPPVSSTYSWGGPPFQTPVSGTFLNSRGSQTCGCESTWAPVCVNGVTFANSCDALCLGMPEKSIGQCGAPIKLQMFWQRFQQGSDCNCHKVRRPVCAEAVTYENSCVALCKGKKNYLVGECDPTYWGPNLKQDNGYGGSTGDFVPVVFVGGCANSQYGCCPDGTAAKGWYGDGCKEKPGTRPPTNKPTKYPTRKPTTKPTFSPTGKPTKFPTFTRSPTAKTKKPTKIPTAKVNCATTAFGCCPDGFPAKGPVKGQGCDATKAALPSLTNWPLGAAVPNTNFNGAVLPNFGTTPNTNFNYNSMLGTAGWPTPSVGFNTPSLNTQAATNFNSAFPSGFNSASFNTQAATNFNPALTATNFNPAFPSYSPNPNPSASLSTLSSLSTGLPSTMGSAWPTGR